MRLEVQLLGHVELRAAGTPIALGAPKRRAVLAGLALDANHPVPLRRLIEMAWPDSPPASAIANLRSHVAALRQVVGDRIVAYSGAYRFRLAPDELDVTEFLRLAGAGQASLLAQDFHGAIAPLAAALALWRGVAGDGVPRGTILDSHWVGLDEQRLQVFDDLTQVRLAVGEDAGLVGELRRHVADHPLRERTWGCSVTVVPEWPHRSATCSRRTPLSDNSETKLCRSPGRPSGWRLRRGGPVDEQQTALPGAADQTASRQPSPQGCRPCMGSGEHVPEMTAVNGR